MGQASLALAAFLVLLGVVQRGFTEEITKGENRSEIETIRDYEVNKIKEKILAQLGLTELPPSSPSEVEINPSELEEYKLISSLEGTETYKDDVTAPPVLTLHSFKGTLQAGEIGCIGTLHTCRTYTQANIPTHNVICKPGIVAMPCNKGVILYPQRLSDLLT